MPEPDIDNFSKEALLALYKETEERIRLHRKLLWEGVRHFAWLISIILSGAAYILMNKIQFVLLSMTLSAIGGIVTLVAMAVIKREQGHFLSALLQSRKVEAVLGLHETVNKKGLSERVLNGSLFTHSDHIGIFKFITEKWPKKEEGEKSPEEAWIEWRPPQGHLYRSFINLFRLYLAAAGALLAASMYVGYTNWDHLFHFAYFK